MKLKKQTVMTAAFWLLLLSPNLLYPFLKNNADQQTAEKRELAAFPTLSFSDPASYPREMDRYINDHAAFRNRFLSLNAALNLNLFHYADAQDVITGKDGWYFFSGGTSLTDCLGLGRFSPEDLAYINSCVQKTAAYFKKQGIDFIVVLPPNKEDVYREYLPAGYEQVSEIGKGQELSAYLKEHSGVPIVDPREDLKSNKNYLWYYKTDTHWNDAAGFLVSQQIISALNGTPTSIEDVTISYSDCDAGDLAALFHMPSKYNTDQAASVSGYLNDTSVTMTDPNGNGSIVFTETKNAPDPRHIAFYRDSFGTAVANTLPKYFKQADFYHWQSFNADFLKERKPDAVIYEIVEREQGRIPDDMRALTPEAFSNVN